MVSFWIFLAFVAAGAQLVRNLSQRELVKDKGPGRPALSRDTANAARYWVGLPFSILAFTICYVTNDQVAGFGARVIFFACLAGFFQILATDMLIRLFQRRAFGIGVAYQKSENLMMALVGPLGIGALFGLSVGNDMITWVEWAGLLMATAGLIIQSFLKLDAVQRQFDGMSMAIGLSCGLAFAITGVSLAEAVRSVEIERLSWQDAVYSGAVVILISQVFQSLIMAGWTTWRHPSEWALIPLRWRGVLTIGFFSFLGSFSLFIAFGLAHPALVSTMKQVDMPLSILVAYLLYRERPQLPEWIGMSLIFASVILIALY